MKNVNSIVLFLGLIMATAAPLNVWAAGSAPIPPKQDWSFNGARASWDTEQLFRGYKVATQVCLACHSFKYIKHRDLMKLGFSEDQVRALSEELELASIDTPFISALTDEAALQLYGTAVPDLSLMTLARPNGTDYVSALLTGYDETPEGVEVPEGKYYNTYFPGHIIAMAPPFAADGQVEYPEGSPEATISQMAQDVSAFFAWTAEPMKVERKSLGMYVLLYLLIFTVLSYMLMKHIWRGVKK